jgi:hypothetical protein
MRSKDRIPPFLEKLGTLWAENAQDWRFGQLMYNFMCSYGDPFFLEEDKFIEELTAFFDRLKGVDDEED